jgi:ribosome-associated protein
MDSVALARAVAEAALSKKAEDVKLMRMREVSGVCDYFVVCSGDAEVQVRAIAEEVQRRLGECGERVWHREGEDVARWILLDYVNVVVHVFHRDSRKYYDLESLWADAPTESISEREAVSG